MIRAIALAVMLVLALGCASCALSQNYEYINDAIRKTAALKAPFILTVDWLAWLCYCP